MQNLETSYASRKGNVTGTRKAPWQNGRVRFRRTIPRPTNPFRAVLVFHFEPHALKPSFMQGAR